MKRNDFKYALEKIKEYRRFKDYCLEINIIQNLQNPRKCGTINTMAIAILKSL